MTRGEVLELLRTNRIRQALMAAPLWRYFAEHPSPDNSCPLDGTPAGHDSAETDTQA